MPDNKISTLTKSLSLFGLVDLQLEECIIKDVVTSQKDRSFVLFIRRGVPIKHIREVVLRYLGSKDFEAKHDSKTSGVIEAIHKKSKKTLTLSFGFSDKNERILQANFGTFVNITAEYVNSLGHEIGDFFAHRALLRSQANLPLPNVNLLEVHSPSTNPSSASHTTECKSPLKERSNEHATESSVDHRIEGSSEIVEEEEECQENLSSTLSNFKEKYEIVQRGHKDSLFVDCVLVGINKSVNEWHLPQCEYKTNGHILESAANFETKNVQSVKLPNGHIFGFRVHAPIAFAKLRVHHGISEEQYANSFQIDHRLFAKKMSSKSGSSFFYTENRLFIVKTISKKDAKFFKSTFEDYYKHMTQNPTLLCVTCGYYTISTTAVGEEIDFIVIKNILPPQKSLCHIFDLKGSTIGRTVSEDERKHNDVSLKDLDFVQYYSGIPMLPEECEKFIQMLERDCQYLANHEIIDYSLVLGIHQVSNYRKTTGSHRYLDFQDKQTSNIVPYFGIVDILTKYSLNKKLELHVKSYLSSGSLKKSDTDKMIPLLSALDPVSYKNRLVQFVKTVVLADTSSSPSHFDRKAKEEGWNLL